MREFIILDTTEEIVLEMWYSLIIVKNVNIY